MGYSGYPVYCRDIADAIQDIEKKVAKIKTNKFEKQDLLELYNAKNEFIKAHLEDENKVLYYYPSNFNFNNRLGDTCFIFRQVH